MAPKINTTVTRAHLVRDAVLQKEISLWSAQNAHSHSSYPFIAVLSAKGDMLEIYKSRHSLLDLSDQFDSEYDFIKSRYLTDQETRAFSFSRPEYVGFRSREAALLEKV